MKKFLFASGFLLLSVSCAFAQKDTGIAVKASTLGAGVEVIKGVSDKLEARLGLNWFSYDHDSTEAGIKYDIDLDLLSVGLLLDYRPFDSNFFLSAGVLWNDNELDLTAKYAGTVTIGDNTYTSSQAGTVRGNLSFDDFAPYIGLGWRSKLGSNSSWSFTFELGVLYQGSPNVSLTADGSLASNSAFLADLEKERSQLDDDLDDYKYYPVVSIGLVKKF